MNKEDEIKLEEQFKKILENVRLQNLLLGGQSMCAVILDKIISAKSKPGKISMNDYKRLVGDIENFCRTGLSRKVKSDGTIEPVDNESTQS